MEKLLPFNQICLPYFIVFLFLNWFQTANAQSIANYTATRTTGISYSSIASTGNSFVSWRKTTGTGLEDDNRSDLTEIGFDFWYNGNKYTDFSVHVNGYMDFSNSMETGSSNYSESYFKTPNKITLGLAPLFTDLTSPLNLDPLANSFKYLVTGVEPNRILTVEWIDMTIFGNTTPNLDFQVKIYESTGIIDFIYGTMSAGTFVHAYGCGLNAAVLSATPTAAQLAMQQTANTTTFSNTPKSNLSILPESNSLLRFTSTISAPATSGALSITAITTNSMNLTWTDWCTNETAYALYYSTNGVDFEFESKLPAGSTSYFANDLDPSTNYSWKIFAVAEGYFSNALSGSGTTNSAGYKTTAGNGNWKNPLLWTPNGVPTSGDDVLIKDGDNVVIDTNAFCFSLTIGSGVSGTLRMGDSKIVKNLTIGSDLILNTGGKFEVNTFDTTHTVILKGNLTNEGTLDFYKTPVRNITITFNKAGNKSVSGNGILTNFGKIILNKGTTFNNTLTVNTANFAAPADFLTLVKGTFKYQVAAATNLIPFSAFDTIPRKTQFKMSAPLSTISFNGGISLFGNLILDTGIVNVGNAINQNLRSDGGYVIINKGTLNVAGSYYSPTQNTLSNFVLYSGSMNVATIGTTSTTNAPFHIQASGSSFRMYGGTILINAEGGTGGQDLGYTNINAFYAVTGGTLQIGRSISPATQTMRIFTTIPIYDLLINNNTATGSTVTDLTVLNNVNNTLGTLKANAKTISIAGQWNRTGGTFVANTGKVLFNGTGIQRIQIPAATTESFNILEINKPTGYLTSNSNTTGSVNITVLANLNLANGNFAIDTAILGLNGTISGNAKLVGSTTSQLTIGGTTGGSLGTLKFDNSIRLNKTLFNLTLNRTGAAGDATIDGSDSLLLTGTLTISNGTLNTGNKLVLISTNAATARIAILPAAGILNGNVIAQRFIAARPERRNRLVSSPVNTSGTGITVSQLIDDVNVSGPSGTANGFDFTALNKPSIYTYNEAVGGSYNLGYVGALTINSSVATGQGMYVQVRGDRYDPLLAAPKFYTQPFPVQSAVTLDFEGVVNRGPISPTLTYTNSGAIINDGYNLVGNPYPSQIDWKSGSWTRTRLDAAIYIYNPLTNSYGTYLHTSGSDNGTNGVGRYISSGQGFFVKANAANPILTFQEAVKSIGTPNQVFRTATEEMAKINLIKDSANQDEIIISFDSLYSATYIESEDANKFLNQTLNLSSRNSGGEDLAINSRPHLQNGDTLFLSVDATTNGSYSLNFQNFATLASGLTIYLKDEFTNTNTDLRTLSNYPFVISADPNSKGKQRFKIITELGAPLPVQLVSFTGRKEGKNTLLTWSSSSEINFANYELEKTDGVKPFASITQIKAKGGAQNFYSYNDLSTYTGINYYRLKLIDANGKFSYSKVVAVNFELDKVFSASIFPIPAENEITLQLSNAKSKTYQLTITDAIGHIVNQKVLHVENGISFKQDITELSKGSYILTISAGEERISTNFIKK